MSDTSPLRAGSGLTLHRGERGLRLAFAGVPDWLGPIGLLRSDAHGRAEAAPPPTGAVCPGHDAWGAYEALDAGSAGGVRATLRAYRDHPLLIFRLEAESDLEGLATGAFLTPSVAWPWLRPALREDGAASAGLRTFGYQSTEFAWPTHGDGAFRGFAFVPHRPASVLPLLVTAAEAGAVLLAPLSGFHEWVGVVPRGDGTGGDDVRIGWHGELAGAPAGFATELAVLAGDGPRAVLETWGRLLREAARTRRRGRYGDVGIARLSYWTDNGSVYYYRTEPGRDCTETLEDVLGSLREAEIPVGSLQLDSWFYPHRNLRGIGPEGAPVVPPSGMVRWEPREDAFPDGLEGLARRLGLPLWFHSRHFDRDSPYFDEHESWRDEVFAHPTGPELVERLMEQAAGWGAITYEQDWMVESFFAVRGLRERPGRAARWQRDMDRAAARRGLTLQWCMATPADFMESVHLDQISSIRTSGDYLYLYDNALNWTWFLLTNAFARALGLWPYKDVFVSHDKTPEGFGEPLAEAESLLATLSGGPVGIGDQKGHSRRDLILRACREDGVLVKPDEPLAAVDAAFRAHAYFGGAPLVGETLSRHPAGTWVYLVTMNASHATKKEGVAAEVRVPLASLGAAAPEGPVVALDWRRGTFERLGPDAVIEEALPYQEFGYRVLCPVLPGEVALFGDRTKYATVGDRRIGHVATDGDALRFDVLGAPGEQVRVEGWSARPPRGAERWTPGSRAALPVSWSEADGRFVLTASVPAGGLVRVRVGW